MTEVEIEAQGDGLVLLHGELSFNTVIPLISKGEELMDVAPALIIDLKDVTRSDSAGLALLVEWMRSARHKNKDIIFRNIPPQMLAVAKVSGLDLILPLG